jgi:thiol-disulfide isomerase/thioredoxin
MGGDASSSVTPGGDLAALAGVFSWSIATAFAGTGSESASLPAVNVVDVNGQLQTLARNDGKPLVVNLWASWCAPCRSEMPVLAQAQREFAGVDVAFVNQGESRAAVSDFVTTQGISLQNLVLTHRWRLRARSAPGRIQPRFSMTAKANCWLSILGRFRKQRFRTHLRRCIRLLSSQDARTLERSLHCRMRYRIGSSIIRSGSRRSLDFIS